MMKRLTILLLSIILLTILTGCKKETFETPFDMSDIHQDNEEVEQLDVTYNRVKDIINDFETNDITYKKVMNANWAINSTIHMKSDEITNMDFEVDYTRYTQNVLMYLEQIMEFSKEHNTFQEEEIILTDKDYMVYSNDGYVYFEVGKEEENEIIRALYKNNVLIIEYKGYGEYEYYNSSLGYFKVSRMVPGDIHNDRINITEIDFVEEVFQRSYISNRGVGIRRLNYTNDNYYYASSEENDEFTVTLYDEGIMDITIGYHDNVEKYYLEINEFSLRGNLDDLNDVYKNYPYTYREYFTYTILFDTLDETYEYLDNSDLYIGDYTGTDLKDVVEGLNPSIKMTNLFGIPVYHVNGKRYYSYENLYKVLDKQYGKFVE